MIGTLVVVILGLGVAAGYVIAQIEAALNERETTDPRRENRVGLRGSRRTTDTHTSRSLRAVRESKPW